MNRPLQIRLVFAGALSAVLVLLLVLVESFNPPIAVFGNPEVVFSQPFGLFAVSGAEMPDPNTFPIELNVSGLLWATVASLLFSYAIFSVYHKVHMKVVENESR